MKTTLMTLATAFAASTLFAVQGDTTGYLNVKDVTLDQSTRTQDVIVTYTLENNNTPAIVLLDIRTNSVSIGMGKIKTVSGDVSMSLTNFVSPGTNKTIIWKAREDWRGNLATNAEAHVLAYYTNNVSEIPGVYMVVDLSEGPTATSYPVTYTLVAPTPLTDVSCASNHLWLKRIESGTFTMGSPTTEGGRISYNEILHEVQLTKAFFMGVFPVTQAQYTLVMGSVPAGESSYPPAAICPVNMVSYNTLRGSTNEFIDWPNTKTNVLASSFFGILRSKTRNFIFDLPTEAQWEYACRAGTTTAWNNGTDFSTNALGIDANLSTLGWYKGNTSPARPVGQKSCNAWGLYDCHGNVFEWCLDWYYGTPGSLTDGGIDPVGNTTGTSRIGRGGSIINPAEKCRSAFRDSLKPDNFRQFYGFRLACRVE